MSVNSTVARTRSSATSAWCPVRNSATSWNEARQSGSTWGYQLRPGSSTYFASGMCSAMYLPFAGGLPTLSVCWTTSVGTRIVGRTARTSNSVMSGVMRASVLGLNARRSIRAHDARISSFHGMSGLATMLNLPGAPHADKRGLNFVSNECGSARIRVTVEHDQRGGARRMCRREQRRWRERAVGREEDRLGTPEVVQYRGDAVGPLLQGRQRARRDGIGRSRARLVEEDESAERCHRLDPPMKGRQFRKDFAARVPVRDVHDVARTFACRAIGDTQVPVQRVARLREHCGSLSRRAARCGERVIAHIVGVVRGLVITSRPMSWPTQRTSTRGSLRHLGIACSRR